MPLFPQITTKGNAFGCPVYTNVITTKIHKHEEVKSSYHYSGTSLNLTP